jgi:hypothetical protein
MKGSMNQPEQIRGKGGRPKRTFNDKDITLIEEYARLNCQNNTIAVALNIPLMTLKRRFGKEIMRWRALSKVDLRLNQRNLAKTSSDMAKFLGTNVLNQVAKQEIVTEYKAKEMTEVEKDASVEAAKAYKLRLA